MGPLHFVSMHDGQSDTAVPQSGVVAELSIPIYTGQTDSIGFLELLDISLSGLRDHGRIINHDREQNTVRGLWKHLRAPGDAHVRQHKVAMRLFCIAHPARACGGQHG